MKQHLTKCNFCRFFTGSACMASQNAHNCAAANSQYYAHMKQNKKANTDRKARQQTSRYRW